LVRNRGTGRRSAPQRGSGTEQSISQHRRTRCAAGRPCLATTLDCALTDRRGLLGAPPSRITCRRAVHRGRSSVSCGLHDCVARAGAAAGGVDLPHSGRTGGRGQCACGSWRELDHRLSYDERARMTPLVFVVIAVTLLVAIRALRKRGGRDSPSDVPVFETLLRSAEARMWPHEALRNAVTSAQASDSGMLCEAQQRAALGDPPYHALSEAAGVRGRQRIVEAAQLLREHECAGLDAVPAFAALVTAERERRAALLTARAGRAGPAASLLISMAIAP